MKVDCLVLGLYETNCYVLHSEKQPGRCVVIDTGLEAEGMAKHLAAGKLEPAAVILTHGHADHIGGVAAVKEKYPQAVLYIHRADANMLADSKANLSLMTGQSIEAPAVDVQVKDGDVIEQAGISMLVLHTPGHTPGGMCLYIEGEDLVFSGDTLFADSVGRTDFPGGSMSRLIESIKSKLLPLPNETKVYPGHGPKTTIGREKKVNRFLM